jgi:hypothetical protein
MKKAPPVGEAPILQVLRASGRHTYPNTIGPWLIAMALRMHIVVDKCKDIVVSPELKSVYTELRMMQTNKRVTSDK